jgi:hypothetical protein
MRIAVLRQGALGDVLLTRPALCHVLAHRAEVELLLMAPGARSRLAVSGLEVDCFDADSAAAAWIHAPEQDPPRVLRDAVGGLTHAVVYGKPDGEVEEAFLRLGASEVRFHPAQPEPGSGVHAVVHLSRPLVNLVGADVPSLRDIDGMPVLRPFEHLPAVVQGVLDVGGAYAVLHPGSGSPRKNAPLDLFAETGLAWLRSGQTAARVVLEQRGWATSETPASSGGEIAAACAASERRLFVVSGEADGNLGQSLVERLPGVSLLEGMDLATLASVLGRSCWYLGNDSGVSHLASQCGARAWVLFRVTEPALWRPVGPRVTVWRGQGGE